VQALGRNAAAMEKLLKLDALNGKMEDGAPV
jgi:hypothetical protein